MARRKAPLHTQSQDLPSQNTSTSREYYNKRYENVDKKHQSTGLYADTTSHHITRIEGLWRKYCQIVGIDPYHTLRKAKQGRIKNYFHWLCNEYSVMKVSAVITYWRQLSQLYIIWRGRRMNPLTFKAVSDYIYGHLAKEHQLDFTENDKPLLDVEDFLKVLRCHWVTDTNTFPHERQRVQLATILLFAALTGSRPSALLAITYQDINLLVLQDKKTGEDTLALQLHLRKTKSRHRVRKQTKTYTFFMDQNPLFCIICHIISLACDDNAYDVPVSGPQMTPRSVLELVVRKGLGCQRVPWRRTMMNIPIFHSPSRFIEASSCTPDEALPYGKYHEWVRRLGHETGFPQVLTTYCLRRATGNAINDDPNSNDAVRNLIMDHASSGIFQRNYLSRMIRYHTQAAYRGTDHRSDLIQAVNRMSLHIDPRRPKELTEAQRQGLRQDTDVKRLINQRDQLFRKIRDDFKFVKRAEGHPIHEQYKESKRDVDRLLKAKQRSLLKQIQSEFDFVIPVQDIGAQLAGDPESFGPILATASPMQYSFKERSRIAAAFSSAGLRPMTGDLNWRISIMDDMVSLCTRQERRLRKTYRSRKLHMMEDTPNDSELDLTSSPIRPEPSDLQCLVLPLVCEPTQCLSCLGNTSLPYEERVWKYGSKYSLQRHFDHCHCFKSGEPCPFPHPECARFIPDNMMHLKNHAARVHRIYMSQKE